MFIVLVVPVFMMEIMESVQQHLMVMIISQETLPLHITSIIILVQQPQVGVYQPLWTELVFYLANHLV